MAKKNNSLKILTDEELLEQFEIAIKKIHYDPIGNMDDAIVPFSFIKMEILNRMIIGLQRRIETN